MKINTLLLLAVFTACSISAYAQAPRQISYQGVLADAQGNLVADGNHSLTLNIYTTATGGTSIYNETQTIPVVHGMFNVIIGAASGIPTSVNFDKAYFLGVTVDNGQELAPRTAMVAAPYAMHAAYADVAGSVVGGGGGSPGASSINQIQGDMTVVGAGSTVITNNTATKTITISSSGGGSSNGVQGVQSTDGTLNITNPNGPVVTVGVANNAITTAKIADSSITLVKIARNIIPTIPTSLPPNGNAGGDLSGTYPNPAVTKIQNQPISNTTPNNGQVLGWNGTNWTPTTPGIILPFIATDNTANAASFDITNTGGNAAIKGTGTIGISANAANANAVALQASGGLIAVSGNTGFGTGVSGNSTKANGVGVEGMATNGASAIGVNGVSPTGIGVRASYNGQANNGTALQVDNGYLKVSGNTKTAYVHTANGNNIPGPTPWVTFLNYPGMAATDIVIATHSLAGLALRKNIGGLFEGTAIGVQWNGAQGRWEIYLEDQQGVIPNGENFNVLVIKQ